MPRNTRQSKVKPYRILLPILLVAVGIFIVQTTGKVSVQDLFSAGPSVVHAADSQPDIQWFKDQMKISDKYLEQREGVLGMSWTHFLTMIVLILFAAGAFAAFILRYRRTQQIIEEIRKEQ